MRAALMARLGTRAMDADLVMGFADIRGRRTAIVAVITARMPPAKKAYRFHSARGFLPRAIHGSRRWLWHLSAAPSGVL